MFSDELHTRDLYFSNPMDHFLTPDHDIKTSYESGFNSSGYRQTGNSTDAYRSSQDLFSQTENPDSQFGVSNSDYQKYISQNLLLGKRNKSPLKRENKEKEKEKHSKHFQTEAYENQFKDIKLSLDCLNDNLKAVNSDIRLSNNSIQDEMTKRYEMLNEKMSLMEKTLREKIEFLSETSKSIAKNFKKQEDERKDFQNKISQISKSVNNLPNNINGYKEHCDKTLHDSVKKILKNYEANKKQAQKVQDLCSQIDKTLSKINMPDALIKDMQEKLENIFDRKLKSLEDYIKDSINQAVQTIQFNGSNSLVQEELQSLGRKTCYQPENSPVNSLFKKQTEKEYYNSGLKNENSHIVKPQIRAAVSSKHLVQTPLAQYIDNFKNNKKNSCQYSLASRGTPDNYTDKISRHKIRVKTTSTPLSKIISPFKRPPIPKSTRSTYEPYPSKCYNNTYNQKRYNQNNIQKISYVHFELNSSPGLTVCDAAIIAKEPSPYKC